MNVPILKEVEAASAAEAYQLARMPQAEFRLIERVPDPTAAITRKARRILENADLYADKHAEYQAMLARWHGSPKGALDEARLLLDHGDVRCSTKISAGVMVSEKPGIFVVFGFRLDR